MTEKMPDMIDPTASPPAVHDAMLDAALLHVPFDGWSEAMFQAALRDVGTSDAMARAVCPRGALDLAVAFHKRGDEAMRKRMRKTDLTAMKIREKVTFAARVRLEAITDKETVRRGSTLFALPQNAAEGAKLIWGTADAIWDALDDPSDGIDWYTKRATLSGVYASTVLYWMGDESPGAERTWAFLDRRIEDVMQIEKVKAQLRGNKLFSMVFAGPNRVLGKVKAPTRVQRVDLPGSWTSGL